MTHGVRGEPDVNVAATRDEGGVSVLLWHYHDDDVAGPDAEIRLTITGWDRPPPSLLHYRMDADHSNAFAVWKGMGRP
ncbi:hypothetical protein J8J40_28085, partial [Mycobacterium tuberculosis]|nr:hypothetical protein [Mycobacterium tuberculosis]